MERRIGESFNYNVVTLEVVDKPYQGCHDCFFNKKSFKICIKEIKPYWSKRLVGFDKPLFSHRNGYQNANVKGFTHVSFSYGYTKRTMIFEIESITIGKGKPEWGAPTDKDVFIIKLKEK